MAGCFASLVFLLSCGCLYSVSLPCGAVGWFVNVTFPGHTRFLLLLLFVLEKFVY